MNVITAVISLVVIALALLASASMLQSNYVMADSNSKQTDNSKQEIKAVQVSQFAFVDPFITGGNVLTSSQNQLTTFETQTSNPLVEKEEFDITVANIKNNDIKVSLTIDGLKNSTVIPGNPPNVITPTSKVVIFKFNRHEDASTPAVLPIKLGDEYTACIAFTANDKNGSCLRAGIDSITQPQKKSLDANYIPF